MMPRSSATSSTASAVPSARVEAGGLGGRGGLERERDQHGPLALDQVVARRLAGRRRVAEHAEQVVAQLERLAERQAVRRTARRSVRRRGAGQRGADVERPLDGVLRRLVAQHGHRVVDVGAAARLHGHVEELPGDDLRPAAVEDLERRSDPVQRHAAPAQQLVGPGQQQVARAGSPRRRRTAPGRRGQPARRCAAAKRAVRGGPAAPGVGGVHQVVVDERAGVQQLERGAGAEHRAARRAPPARQRGSPSSRTPRGTACRRLTAARASATSRAASSPSGASRPACSSRKPSSAAWRSARNRSWSPGPTPCPVTGPIESWPQSGGDRARWPVPPTLPHMTTGRGRSPRRPRSARAIAPSRSSSSRRRTRPARSSCGTRSARWSPTARPSSP